MILLGNASERDLLELVNEKKGSIVAYFGYVRKIAHGKEVKKMLCTEKEDTRKIMEGIENEIKRKFPVEKVILYHTIGEVKVGALLAAVIISSVHRREGFEACQYGIDRIKKLEPVIREEHL